MNTVKERPIEDVKSDKATLQVTFTGEGVSIGESFITFSDNAYDDFVYTLQKYGLRNLVEYANRFTVTHEPLIEELRQLDGTHAGMTIISYEIALEMFNNKREVYKLYDDGSEGLVEEIERIHEHNAYGGEFGHEY